MPTPPLTREQMQEAVEAVEKYGSAKKAAQHLGINSSTLHSRYQRAMGLQDPTIERETTLYKINPNDPEDRAPILEWVRKGHGKERQIAIMREMAEEFKSGLPKIKKRPKVKIPPSDFLNLINIGDAHIGSYIWDEECGQSFDLSIAKNDLCTAMDYLIDEGPAADTLVIAPVGDYLHADNIAGATSKGTPLDLDTRMPKVIRTGVSVLRYAIEKGLDKHQNVHVVITPGNHDEILSHCLSIMLDEVYSKEPRVVIHSEPTHRHYMVFGKVLLGWIHGHLIKDEKIPIAVATEKSKEWGQTEFRYIFRGHHHHKSMYKQGLRDVSEYVAKEYNGAMVEQVRPLCPSDAYATRLGMMAGNDCMNITFDKETGEAKRVISSLRQIRRLQGLLK